MLLCRKKAVLSGRRVGVCLFLSLLSSPPSQTVTATPLGPRAMPAGRTRGWDAVSANPTSRATTASSVLPDSTDLAATVSTAPPSSCEVLLHQVSTNRSVASLLAACQCSSPGVANGLCDPESGQCTCRTGFEGDKCDHCALGYFHFPLCQREWYPCTWA